ncbi:monothiol glutaredoxin-S1-like [Primulina huaijiensis]|uniref:monothiol glutaredoxin-S1-like n=1 Tax=Primulina huaijiensis TaxID=1492673 RepID=UPI003CC78A0D
MQSHVFADINIPSCKNFFLESISASKIFITSLVSVSPLFLTVINFKFSPNFKPITMDVLMMLGAANSVVIFSKTSCCMSHSIKTLISSFGANPTIYEIDKLPNGKQIEKVLKTALGCNPTVPAVFIGKEFVGGSNEIMSLNIQGKLKPLLIRANAIWI